MIFDQLKELILNANNISIISHNSPDEDCVSGGLLLYGILNQNFKDKTVNFNIEDPISKDYIFLKNSEKITDKETVEFLNETKPDILFVVDGNQYVNFTNQNAKTLKTYLVENKIITVNIDHHPLVNNDNFDLIINRGSSSASEEIYKVFIEELKLEKFEGTEETAMFGMIADSGRFLYLNKDQKDTFRLASEFLEKGITIQSIQDRITRFSKFELEVISELIRNLNEENGYNYSFISDDYAKEYRNRGGDWNSFSNGRSYFVDEFIRSTGENVCGFAIIPDFSKGDNYYYGSIRVSLSSPINAGDYARKLGGSGHKGAAGFSIQASCYTEAIEKIKAIFNNPLN